VIAGFCVFLFFYILLYHNDVRDEDIHTFIDKFCCHFSFFVVKRATFYVLFFMDEPHTVDGLTSCTISSVAFVVVAILYAIDCSSRTTEYQ